MTAVVHMFATAVPFLAMLKKMGRLLHMNKASTLQRALLRCRPRRVHVPRVRSRCRSIWAHAYLRVGAIEQLETALYFSMVTFTTLGYGDVTLSPDWRLLASFEAANGIMMFGWTTALIAAVIQRLAYRIGTADMTTLADCCEALLGVEAHSSCLSGVSTMMRPRGPRALSRCGAIGSRTVGGRRDRQPPLVWRWALG